VIDRFITLPCLFIRCYLVIGAIRPERGPIGGRIPQTTLELSEALLEFAKVAIVPGEAFGAPGYARLSFALSDDDLGEGLRRIADALGG
jgi:aspartate/methionine/tyrosine aminotransferase